MSDGEKKPKFAGEGVGRTYEDYATMSSEELAEIANDNETTPEKFLASIKQRDALRRAADDRNNQK